MAAIGGVAALVTTRLDPGVDALVEARLRGHVLGILRVGIRRDEGLDSDSDE